MYTVRSTKTAQGELLTPAEQEVYLSLLPDHVTTLGDVTRILRNYSTARSILWRLQKKGFVRRVRGGLYVLAPPELRGKDVVADPYILAARAAHGRYFLSYHSALEIHGIAHSRISTTFASVSRRRGPFEYQGMAYNFVLERHFFGLKDVLHAGVTIKVSDLERTVVECIRRLDLAGGLEEVLKSYQGLPYLNRRRVLSHLGLFGVKSLYHRLGFVLSMVGEGGRVPEGLLAALKAKLSQRTYYLVPGTQGGRYNSEWRLVVPRNVEALLRGV